MTIICPVCRGNMRWHNEKYMCPVCGYDDTPKSTIITGVKVKTSDEFICPKCGCHTALVCRVDGTYQAHCMICAIYYDVEIEKATNADRIRQMTDEELAVWIAETANCSDWCILNEQCKTKQDQECCINVWFDWLKEEAESEG